MKHKKNIGDIKKQQFYFRKKKPQTYKIQKKCCRSLYKEKKKISKTVGSYKQNLK